MRILTNKLKTAKGVYNIINVPKIKYTLDTILAYRGDFKTSYMSLEFSMPNIFYKNNNDSGYYNQIAGGIFIIL